MFLCWCASTSTPSTDHRLKPRLSVDRAFVLAAAHLAARKDAVLLDPLKGFLKGLFRIRLEHQSLAGTPTPRIYRAMEAHRELLLVVVGIKLRPQVDVALRATQRAEVFTHVFRVGCAG